MFEADHMDCGHELLIIMTQSIIILILHTSSLMLVVSVKILRNQSFLTNPRETLQNLGQSHPNSLSSKFKCKTWSKVTTFFFSSLEKRHQSIIHEPCSTFRQVYYQPTMGSMFHNHQHSLHSSSFIRCSSDWYVQNFGRSILHAAPRRYGSRSD